jgi:hypothetical protein
LFNIDLAVTVPRRRQKYFYVRNCVENSARIEKNRKKSRKEHGRDGIHKISGVWFDIFTGNLN